MLKKFLSYAGAFSEIPVEDYKNFINETRSVREDLGLSKS